MYSENLSRLFSFLLLVRCVCAVNHQIFEKLLIFLLNCPRPNDGKTKIYKMIFSPAIVHRQYSNEINDVSWLQKVPLRASVGEKREAEGDLRGALTPVFMFCICMIVYLAQNPWNVLDNVGVNTGQLWLCTHNAPAHLFYIMLTCKCAY